MEMKALTLGCSWMVQPRPMRQLQSSVNPTLAQVTLSRVAPKTQNRPNHLDRPQWCPTQAHLSSPTPTPHPNSQTPLMPSTEHLPSAGRSWTRLRHNHSRSHQGTPSGRASTGGLDGVTTSISSADATITLDLRWTVLCDLFLVLTADMSNDARSRVLLERVASYLCLTWMDVTQFEKRVTDALEIEEGVESLSDHLPSNSACSWLARSAW